MLVSLFRGVLLMALLPGLAAMLTLPAPGSSAAGVVYVRFTIFVTVGIAVIWLLRGARLRQPVCDARSLNVCLVLVVVTPLVLVLRGPGQVTAVTFVGATVEEVLFRLELPLALATILGGRRIGAVAALLLAQATFALSHFGVAFRMNATNVVEFVRLFGCGVCLALILRASGSLTLCVVLHFVINESVWGFIGIPRPIGVGAAVSASAAAVLCLVFFEATSGGQQPLRPMRAVRR